MKKGSCYSDSYIEVALEDVCDMAQTYSQYMLLQYHILAARHIYAFECVV